MPWSQALRAFGCLVAKDVTGEVRAHRAWPAMVLLGLVLVVALQTQTDASPGPQHEAVGGFLWLGVCFAGLVALERSFAVEREQGCWAALLLYPVPPAVLFLAKLAVNLLALVALECVLLPALAAATDAPLFERPFSLGLVVLLGNVGFASLGVSLSALTCAYPHRSSLLTLLLLPLAFPVVWGASSATRLLVVGEVGAEWWCWVRFLAAFAVLFTTAGMMLFGAQLED
jgi:heme exporter protein B